MSDLILFISSQEQNDIRSEIAGKPAAVIFDGTTRLVKQWPLLFNLSVIFLYTTKVYLFTATCEKHDGGRNCLGAYQCPFSSVWYWLWSFAGCYDNRTACNGVALCTVKVVYSSIINVGCFSHTLPWAHSLPLTQLVAAPMFTTWHVQESCPYFTYLLIKKPHKNYARLIRICLVVGFIHHQWEWTTWHWLNNSLYEVRIKSFLHYGSGFGAGTRELLLQFQRPGTSCWTA